MRNLGISQDTDSQKRLRLAKANELRLLYRQSFPAVFASLLAGVLVCIALWPVQDHGLLLTWFVLLGLSSLVRVALFLNYRKAAPEGEALLRWEFPYAITLYTSSAIWGIGALFILPDHYMLHQLVLLFFLVGMSGGALGVYTPHRRMMLTTIGLMVVPSTLWLAMQGTTLGMVMTVGLIVFLITVYRASGVLTSHMHKSFLLSLELDEARGRAEHQAREDQLTGMSNRRAFHEQGEKLKERRKPGKEQLAMIMLDVDHFKKINDSYGHDSGDLVLQHLARLIQQTVRATDVCARIGGEEFGILLLASGSEEVVALARKLCRRIAETPIRLQGKHRGTTISVTASFGVAVRRFGLERLYKDADAALYRAKEEGRNRVVYAACA